MHQRSQTSFRGAKYISMSCQTIHQINPAAALHHLHALRLQRGKQGLINRSRNRQHDPSVLNITVQNQTSTQCGRQTNCLGHGTMRCWVLNIEGIAIGQQSGSDDPFLWLMCRSDANLFGIGNKQTKGETSRNRPYFLRACDRMTISLSPGWYRSLCASRIAM